MRGLVALGMLALSTLSCAGDEDDEATKLAGEPLDCAWIASNNCWKTLVQSAESCVPPESENGALSSDGKSCTYASGYDIAFNEPLVLPLEDFPSWDFVQNKGGAPCVTYSESEDASIYLDVQGMTLKEISVGFALQVTCPDGSQFAAQNALELFECPDLFSSGPGSVAFESGGSVSFALPRGMESALGVFACSR